MKYILLLGRIFFSAIFIIKAFSHFGSEMIDYAASMGAPMPDVLVPLAGILSLLGGLSILLGFKARIGAWLLVIFLLPTAFVMHKYWEATDPFTAMMQHYCFWKNLSMLGASLMITYFGSGPLSLDQRRR